MKDQILSHLNHAGELEKLYRSNKSLFRREFNTLYPEIQGSQFAVFWNERLNYEPQRTHYICDDYRQYFLDSLQIFARGRIWK